MEDSIISFLKSIKKSTITLTQLENIFSGDISYDTFATSIRYLVDKGVLTEISPEVNNGKSISLAYKFRIHRYKLKQKLIEEIQNVRLKLEPEIDLQEYFILSEDIWHNDLPYIQKVNEYIKNTYPIEEATPQERSFHIIGDEKWIDEKGGRRLLARLKIWDKLKIVSAGEPLMLAVNSAQFQKEEHLHLIVENKATFYAMLNTLKETKFTSLIFGSGWKVVSNISMLNIQLGLRGENILYYFGDMDYEGISIWNALNEKVTAKLAIEFYSKLLEKNYSIGKENQQKNKIAMGNFVKNFEPIAQEQITRLLEAGGYYPQEGLNKEELDNIWRSTKWQ